MSTLRAGGILTLITSALSYDICYSAISGLAQYDKLFGEAPADPSHSREIQKETFGALDSTTDDFVDDMRARLVRFSIVKDALCVTLPRNWVFLWLYCILGDRDFQWIGQPVPPLSSGRLWK